MGTAFADDAVSVAVSDRTAQKWFNKFSSGDLSCTDETRTGKPKIINNKDIKQTVEANFSTRCLELAERFSMIDEIIS
ncbi:hypothetical protein Trydic_g2061 [Trypoxylus dichotomus]